MMKLKALQTGKTTSHAAADEEEKEPLSPSSRLLHDPSFNLHILALIAFDSDIDPHFLTLNLSLTFLKHPRFTSLMRENNGKMEWVRTEVDLTQHIIVVPPPAHVADDDGVTMRENNSKFVDEYVSELSKERMKNMCRPLWDIHVLNVRTRDAEAVAVLRMHHALGDGASLISMLLACTRQVCNPQLLPTIPTATANKPKSPPAPPSKMRLIWNTIVDVVMFVATIFFLKDSKTPITPSPASESKPRRIVHSILSFHDFHFIKTATHMTINDVALGVTQAALSMYLNTIYGEVNKEDKGSTEEHNNLPKNLRLRSVLFFNLRPAKGIVALAELMKKEKGTGSSSSSNKWGWGNRFGYGILPFRIGICDDPLDYIRDAHATAQRIKFSYLPLLTHFLTNFIIALFGSKGAGIMTKKLFSNASTSFSNVVGPRQEIELYGHPVAFVAPTCYGQPSALMVHFQSYANKMAVVISVDESVIPHPHRFLHHLRKSLHLIKDAAAALHMPHPPSKNNNII